MNRFRGIGVGVLALAVVALSQRPQSRMVAQELTSVPPFLPVTGVLTDASGQPMTGLVEVTLAIYTERTGGTPLWSERQTIEADPRGQYTLTLGASISNGVPAALFGTGGFRWLGVTATGQPELPRTPILSVPYALKAADADTLGGKPASAFVVAIPSNSSTADSKTGNTQMAPAAAGGGGGGGQNPSASTFTSTANPGPGFISQATSGPPLQVSSTVVNTNLNADLVDGLHATAFAQLAAANTFAANQTVNGTLAAVQTGAGGIGVSAEANSTSGPTIGVQALVRSGAGIAGRFDNEAGGALIQGAVQGTEKFRVDGNGSVYANSYHDLAGNPINSGTVTSVNSGAGLTGGPITSSGTLALDTAFTNALYAAIAHGHDVSQITNAAALSANTFTATQTIDGGNLDLDPSTPSAGNITKNGALFLHNAGGNNLFLGINAGNFTLTGGGNTAVGSTALGSTTSGSANTALGTSALRFNTIGHSNTGVGSNALTANTEGTYNTAIGLAALYSNTTGTNNNATGSGALYSNISGGGNTAASDYALYDNTTGSANTAIGQSALRFNTTGSQNVAVGVGAGMNATTGMNNIYLGFNVNGLADESNAMYLGKVGTQTKTVVAGIRGTSVAGGEMVVIDANGRLGSSPVGGGANSVGTNEVIDDSLTASDLAPNSVTGSELASDSVTADKVAFNYAGSTAEGGPASDLACIGCVAASEVSFSFASLGANTFTATQTIDAGNLDLDASTATTGNITKNGAPFLHNFGVNNTFAGVNAGNTTMTADGNTAVGTRALAVNTTGPQNIAIGWEALAHNTTGDINTAIGAFALTNNVNGYSNTALGRQALRDNSSGHGNTATGTHALLQNTTGSNNTADGSGALFNSTTGDFNTAVGGVALLSNITGSRNTAAGFQVLYNSGGSDNVAVGYQAGINATSGSNNIYLGANVLGVAGESNTMYLGKQGAQAKTFVAGVRGITTVNADAIPVVIDSAGQLGTLSSSRRFKEDIRDMADTSRRLFQLRPVTFRYKQPFGDGSKPVQYGLVAEEVAEAFPELAVRSADGTVETVHYETLSVLLLNEVQRQERELEQQREYLQKQQRRIDALEQQLQFLVGMRER